MRRFVIAATAVIVVALCSLLVAGAAKADQYCDFYACWNVSSPLVANGGAGGNAAAVGAAIGAGAVAANNGTSGGGGSNPPPPIVTGGLCAGHGGGDGIDNYLETVVEGGAIWVVGGVICPDGHKVETYRRMGAPAGDPGQNYVQASGSDSDGNTSGGSTPGGDDYCAEVWATGGWDPAC